MGTLQNLRYLLQERDYLCKLDLKNAYCCVPLQKFNFGGQETYTNFYAYVLAWVLPHKFSENN